MGGAIAWTAHILLIYVISEWGCVKWPPRFAFYGITATAWLLIAVSALLLFVSVAAAYVGFRYQRRGRDFGQGEDADVPYHTEEFVSRTGLIMSGTFAFIILVESIPTFYFLQRC
jgi:hypothetical protein